MFAFYLSFMLWASLVVIITVTVLIALVWITQVRGHDKEMQLTTPFISSRVYDVTEPVDEGRS